MKPTEQDDRPNFKVTIEQRGAFVIVRDIVGSIVQGLTRGSIRSRVVSATLLMTILTTIGVIVSLVVFREPLGRMVARPASVDTSVQHRAVAAVDQLLRHHVSTSGADRLTLVRRDGGAVPIDLKSRWSQLREGRCVSAAGPEVPGFFRDRGIKGLVICPVDQELLLLEFLEPKSADQLRSAAFDLWSAGEVIRTIQKVPEGRGIFHRGSKLASVHERR